MHTIPWIVLFAFYSIAAATAFPEATCYFTAPFYIWEFNLEILWGKYLFWHNFVFNFLCAAIDTAFNVVSLKWVHETRKTIISLTDKKNRRREIKLLIQCLIIGAVFAMTSIMFTIVYAAGYGGNQVVCVIQHYVWTMNHCINPMVYLSVNSRLRQRFVQWISCGAYKTGNQNTVNVVQISAVRGATGPTGMNPSSTGTAIGHGGMVM